MMPRVHIWSDSRYPDFGIQTAPRPMDETVEITEAQLQDYKRVYAEYTRVQNELAKLEREQK